jgi:hypothetical protein
MVQQHPGALLYAEPAGLTARAMPEARPNRRGANLREKALGARLSGGEIEAILVKQALVPSTRCGTSATIRAGNRLPHMGRDL